MAARKRTKTAPWYQSTWLLLIVAVAVVLGVRWFRNRQAVEPSSEPETPTAQAADEPVQEAPPPIQGPGSSLALHTDVPGTAGADAPLRPGATDGVLRQVLDPGVLPTLTQGAYTADRISRVAEVSGTVTYRGILRDEVIVPSVDRLARPEHPVGDLVLENGRLAHALLWLEGVEAGNAIASTGGFQIQECALQPRVAFFGEGGTAKLANADSVAHEIVAEDAAGDELFRVALAPGAEKQPALLARTGLFRLRCERHPWESATLLVLPHPYAATTTTLGTFHLGAVPVPESGQVVLRLFHPALGTFEQALALTPGHPMALEIDLTENLQ